MAITGISHITFVVRNVDRTAKLWKDGLGASEVYDSGENYHSLSREKFFLLGGIWIVIMQGEPGSRSYRHVAFEAPANELPEIEQRLRSLNAEIKAPRSRIEGEGSSLYFFDYDDNLIEIHSGTLDSRLKQYDTNIS